VVSAITSSSAAVASLLVVVTAHRRSKWRTSSLISANDVTVCTRRKPSIVHGATTALANLRTIDAIRFGALPLAVPRVRCSLRAHAACTHALTGRLKNTDSAHSFGGARVNCSQ
jgi:hypothetical protein